MTTAATRRLIETAASKTSAEADAFARRAAGLLLANRKGHGGGPCKARRMTEAQLVALIALAFDAGLAKGAGR
jgi:hypothetical protein